MVYLFICSNPWKVIIFFKQINYHIRFINAENWLQFHIYWGWALTILHFLWTSFQTTIKIRIWLCILKWRNIHYNSISFIFLSFYLNFSWFFFKYASKSIKSVIFQRVFGPFKGGQLIGKDRSSYVFIWVTMRF